MKKFVITAIIALTSFSVLSQKLPDSTVVANRDIKDLLAAFEDWKNLRERDSILTSRVMILEKGLADCKVFSNQQTISIQRYEEVVNGYKKSEENLLQQRLNLERESKELRKQLRKEKTKTFIGSLAGVVATVAILIFK